MHHVFISYSTKNKAIADHLCSCLESNGISCWYAPRNILPGKDWAEAIMEAIDSAKVFLLIYSSESNNSRQVSNEVTAAFNAGCTLVPYRISNDKMCGRLAYYLNSVHWIDAVSASESEKIKQLLSYLRKELNIPDKVTLSGAEAVRASHRSKPTSFYSLPPIQALDRLIQQSSSNPDATVTVQFKLGIDASQEKQYVSGSVILPHGTGINRRVLAITTKVMEAVKAGADYVGGINLINKIVNEMWFDYDIVVVSPEMISSVVRISHLLGPKGLMPSPKLGTLTPYVGKAVQAIKSGQVEFRIDDHGIINCPIGKVSFGSKKLTENLRTLAEAIMKEKRPAHNCPHSGQFIRECSVSTDLCQDIKIAASYYD